MWPGNSPELTSLRPEHLRGIFQQELDNSEPCNSVRRLTESLQSAWTNIPRDLLERLVASMPSRVSKCRTFRSEHIGMFTQGDKGGKCL